MRILVVENNAVVCCDIAEGLRRAGYETFEASSGEEALRILENERPDVLVADIDLGGISGWEVAERGRAMNPRLAVIYASGFPPDRSREVRGSLHLTKPFKVGQVIAAATNVAVENSF